mmetsp:Transcript_6054/g.14958  ORF Transcript_6054/g.14958 Transcript_6054/m.14958 type:complete len:173 (-) Transcript_6054:91-609(-)
MVSIPELKGEEVVQVDGGYCHTLALTADGRVLSMGCGEDGQRGCGIVADEEGEQIPPVTEVPLPEAAAAVSAGLNHSLALTTGGSVYSWGSNEYGQLGVPGEEPAPSPVRVQGLPEGGKAVSVSAGSTHSHVVYEDGQVFSFGGGGNGQLMDGGSCPAHHAPTPAVAPRPPS